MTSERSEKTTLAAFKEAIIPTVWLSPGVIALFPYAARPVSYDGGTGLVDYIHATGTFILGVGPYLSEHPWMAAMTLPSVLYIWWWARGPY